MPAQIMYRVIRHYRSVSHGGKPSVTSEVTVADELIPGEVRHAIRKPPSVTAGHIITNTVVQEYELHSGKTLRECTAIDWMSRKGILAMAPRPRKHSYGRY